MSLFLRTSGLLTIVLLASAGSSPAATPKEIEAALKKGTESIKARYAVDAPPGNVGGEVGYGIGPACLSGLALLEAGVPVTDKAVATITAMVREAALAENRTYQIALCLMYLDRLGDKADVPLIQVLAIRLLAGQSSQGGWSYECVANVSAADIQFLRGIKPGEDGKLHPDVARYAQAVVGNRGIGRAMTDDNSNTQFGVLALWMARKHGVPVDDGLRRIEARFLATQNARTGGWPYNSISGPAADIAGAMGSPAMHCAGLIGLATAVGRREERLAAKNEPKKDDSKGEPKKGTDDPFFNPPKGAEPKKAPPKRAKDNLDRAVEFAFAGLGQHVAESARANHGALSLRSASHGHHDMYFLWSLERVGVIFGVDRIGGVDWYEAGAHTLVHTQLPDGSWTAGGSYGTEVNTAFAVLFLCKSNLARDLSGKVQKEIDTELRAGQGPTGNKPGDFKPNDPTAGSGTPDPYAPTLPGVVGSEVGTLAGQLLRSVDKDKEWVAALKTLREGKGSIHTQALVVAIGRLDGDRLSEAREALAERLTRMTADTLRAMAKSDEPELRRGAVLAMAMKDDKNHVPDLVAALADDEDLVVRAARAGLRSLTGQDFGPGANATAGEKKIATDAWRNWLSKQKK